MSATTSVLVGTLLQISNGHYSLFALALAAVATALAFVRVPVSPDRVFAIGIATGLVCMGALPVGIYDSELVPLVLVRVFAWLGLVVFALSFVDARARRVRFPAMLVLYVAMGISMVRASPRPRADVWVFQQEGTSALLRGEDPYAVTYPNVYGDSTFYDASLLDAATGRVAVNPYPPLTMIWDAPFRILFGDVRYGMVLATALAALAIRSLSREGAGEAGELAALFVLCQPRAMFVIEQAWTEPTVLAAFGWLLVAITRKKSWPLVGALAAAVLATKQYGAILALPLLFAIPPALALRAAPLALALLTGVTAPFVLWEPREFYRDVVRMQVVQPLRLDGLSAMALLARALGGAERVPRALVSVAFVALAAVYAWAVRPKMTLARAAWATAAAWLVFVLLNKQAFCNYYWLAVGLFAAASALSPSSARAKERPS